MIARWNLVFSILRAASEAAYPTRQSQHTLRAAQMLVSSSDDKYGGLASSDGLFSTRALRILVSTQVSYLQTGCSAPLPQQFT